MSKCDELHQFNLYHAKLPVYVCLKTLTIQKFNRNGKLIKSTYRLSLLVFFHCLVRGIAKLHLRTQLRDNVMAGSTDHPQFSVYQYHYFKPEMRRGEDHHLLVCVEPLGHFHSGNGGISSGHGEVDIEFNLATIPSISGGNGAEHGCGVEHLIVV